MDPASGALLATAIGALLKAGSGLFSHKGKVQQYPVRSQEQLGNMRWAGQQGKEQISNPMKGFDPISQLVQGQYKQNVMPSILERFGGNSAMTSPSLHSTLARSGGDLQEKLAALGSNYSMNQQKMGQNLLGLSLGPEFENIYKGGGHTFGSAALSGLGDAAGTYGQLGFLEQFLNGQKKEEGNPSEEPWSSADVNRLLDPLSSRGSLFGSGNSGYFNGGSNQSNRPELDQLLNYLISAGYR